MIEAAHFDRFRMDLHEFSKRVDFRAMKPLIHEPEYNDEHGGIGKEQSE